MSQQCFYPHVHGFASADDGKQFKVMAPGLPVFLSAQPAHDFNGQCRYVPGGTMCLSPLRSAGLIEGLFDRGNRA